MNLKIMVVLKGTCIPMPTIIKFRQFDEHLQDIFRIIKSGPEKRKNYLTLVKLKFLFLALLSCSIQMQKTASVFSFLFTNFNSLSNIVQRCIVQR